MPISPESIIEILKEIENAPVECDGFCRMASYLLSNAGIEHECYIGSLTLEGDGIIPLHFWIKAGSYFIDYRARMWLGERAPHGVFTSDSAVLYDGELINLGKINQTLLDLLSKPVTIPWPR